MFDITQVVFKRLIAHKIFPKVNGEPAYAETEKNLYILNDEISAPLKEKVHQSFTHGYKYFKLQIEDHLEGSFFNIVNSCRNESDDYFVSATGILANKLADSQTRANIPGGVALMLDGFTTDQRYFFIVIKAEEQDMFTLNKKDKKIEILKNGFLSPSKEFYKVGLLVDDKNVNSYPPNDSFSCYMYDDQFTLQKHDLTDYFYNKFLGFTTDKNDELLSKKFYDDFRDFCENSVDDYSRRMRLLKIVEAEFKDDQTRMVISPYKFSEEVLTPSEFGLFNKEYLRNYTTNTFTKNPSLFKNKIEGKQKNNLSIIPGLTLTGTTDTLNDKTKIFRSKDLEDNESRGKLIQGIENGREDIGAVILVAKEAGYFEFTQEESK